MNACDDENYHGSRRDIVDARDEIKSILSKEYGVDVDYLLEANPVGNRNLMDVATAVYDKIPNYKDVNDPKKVKQALKDLGFNDDDKTVKLVTDKITKEIGENKSLLEAGKPRELPKEYKHSGMTFKQIDRTKNAAIYADEKAGVWEIFKIKIGKASKIKTGGKVVDVPERERLPGNEDFGKWAWSFSDETKAWNQYKKIA